MKKYGNTEWQYLAAMARDFASKMQSNEDVDAGIGKYIYAIIDEYDRNASSVLKRLYEREQTPYKRHIAGMRFSYLLTTPLANALDNSRRCESSGISIYGSSDKKDFYRRRLFDVISTSEVARKEHIVNVRQNQERWDAAVENGKCPRCGGDLVLREGKYGQFYGCSNYPKCKYILNK